MAPDQEVVTILKAYVATDDSNTVAVGYGKPLPDNAKDGEADRLRALGALGVIGAPADGDSGDQVDALAASLTEAQILDYVKDHTVKEITAAVGDDAELAAKVLAAEQDGGEPREGVVKAMTKVIGAPADGDSGE